MIHKVYLDNISVLCADKYTKVFKNLASCQYNIYAVVGEPTTPQIVTTVTVIPSTSITGSPDASTGSSVSMASTLPTTTQTAPSSSTINTQTTVETTTGGKG